jgi:hypothetical protein
MIDSFKYHREISGRTRFVVSDSCQQSGTQSHAKILSSQEGRELGLKGRSLFISQAPRVLLIEMKEESKSFK